jgi:hypothetical protein
MKNSCLFELSLLSAVLLLPLQALACDGPQGQSVLIQGEYSVPVSPELEPFSRYPVDDFCWGKEGESVMLEYSLPRELTGAPVAVVLKGQDNGQDKFLLEGPLGKAECTREGSAELRNVKCMVRYQNLQMNFGQAARLLVEKFSEPSELMARMKVTILFQGEPEGIIAFPLAPPAP